MPKMPHLVMRGPIYYLRRKLPLAVTRLVAKNPGLWKILTGPGGPHAERWGLLIGDGGGIKDLIFISLNTSVSRDAQEALRAKDAEIDALLRDVQRVFDADKSEPKRELTDPECLSLARIWLHRQEKSLPEEEIFFGSAGAERDEIIQTAKEDFAYASDLKDPENWGWANKQAKKLVAEFAINVNSDGPSYNCLLEYLLRAERERSIRRLIRLDGTTHLKNQDTTFKSVDGEHEPTLPIATLSLSISQLITRYLADLNQKGVSEKTKIGYRVIFSVLQELLGPDKPVKSINRQDCRKVLELLLVLPANAPKKFPGMKLVDIAEKAKAEGIPGRMPGTLRSYLINLTALFNYAVEEEYMDSNPAKGLQDKIPKGSSKERWKPFRIDQLQTIFNAPLYTGCQDDERGYAIPGPNVIRRGRFWVPLLSLFHGIRENEACQLLVSDIIAINCIPVIQVQEDELDDEQEGPKKKLKTEASTRNLPLHPELVKMGFLNYVEGMRANGKNQLFPDLTTAATGYMSDNFSKWFGRFLTKAGAAEPRTSFHSFRHCFRDALRRAGISHDMVLLLGGWSGGGTDQDYGHGDELLPALAKEIAKIEYPGLDLSHLYE